MEEIKLNMLGQMDNTIDNTFESANRVYDCNGLCPTIPTMAGGNIEPKTIVAMRGRNPQNPSDRTTGAPTEQRLEPNSQGLCNTITSVQKDNLVLESAILTPKRTEYGKEIRKSYESGIVKESRHNMTQLEPRNDGISNTLTTVQKDNMVLEHSVVGTLYSGASEQFGCGYMPDICKTLKANKDDTSILIKQATETGICRIESLYRIRKLTPRECGRLMFVSDKNITKILSVVSNSQAYKQFSNSIVVLVMVAMFSNLNIQNKPRWRDIKDIY